MSSCVGTPISWLRLERFHGGELAPDEREEIRAHLDRCAACAACLLSIEEDDRALAPLAVVPIAVRRRRRRRGQLAAAASVVALAAAVLLFVRTRPRPSEIGAPTPPAATGARAKGDGVAFALVRDDDTVFDDAGGVYRDGDRFKALVTCPPGMRGGWDVAVYERGEAAFPLPPAADVACANAVPLPGAFRLTGTERLVVCLVWNPDGSVDRDRVRRTPPDELDSALCKSLDAAP